MAVKIDPNLFNQYVSVSRTVMAELSKVVGDSYDPGEDYDFTNSLHRVVAISQTILQMTSSLHAFHPPMVGPPGITPASQVSGIPPADAPPATPLQMEQPPASV